MAERISWGPPAQIADSKESETCGWCDAKRGFYGQHFGIAPDGNPLPVIEDFAFDLTVSSFSISALCWACGFSFVCVLREGEPDPAPKPPKKKRKPKKKKKRH
jgi:hypothetical protein